MSADRHETPLEGHERYRAIRKLGQGAMGEVFLARHLALEQQVVIKVIHGDLAQSPGDVDRMRFEAQALARLDHPNVVRVIDFDQTASGRPFIVMEFLVGQTLAEEVAASGGVLPAVEAVDVVRQGALGLTAAHEAGLVHRDLKLENLFVFTRTGSTSHGDARALAGRFIKLIDFGLAKPHGKAVASPAPLVVPTTPGAVVGTPSFLAPEQASGRPVDWRADIYAMGLVLYNLLAGRGPFEDATTVLDMIQAQLSRRPEPPSRFAAQAIVPELDAVVLRCLAKEPGERFQTAAELADKLDNIATRLRQADDATAEKPGIAAAAAAVEAAVPNELHVAANPPTWDTTVPIGASEERDAAARELQAALQGQKHTRPMEQLNPASFAGDSTMPMDSPVERVHAATPSSPPASPGGGGAMGAPAPPVAGAGPVQPSTPPPAPLGTSLGASVPPEEARFAARPAAARPPLTVVLLIALVAALVGAAVTLWIVYAM